MTRGTQTALPSDRSRSMRLSNRLGIPSATRKSSGSNSSQTFSGKRAPANHSPARFPFSPCPSNPSPWGLATIQSLSRWCFAPTWEAGMQCHSASYRIAAKSDSIRPNQSPPSPLSKFGTFSSNATFGLASPIIRTNSLHKPVRSPSNPDRSRRVCAMLAS